MKRLRKKHLFKTGICLLLSLSLLWQDSYGRVLAAPPGRSAQTAGKLQEADAELQEMIRETDAGQKEIIPEADAEQAEAVAEDEGNDGGSGEKARILCEIESARGEYTKEYLLSDFAREVVVYPEPVHYETENGTLAEIDNRLLHTGDGYVNAGNDYRLFITDNKDVRR